MIVVAIHSRFLFEKHVFEMRTKRELSATELYEAMSDAQIECFGDALDPDQTHPYMWCVSPHYYSLAYYNWPYTFGLLFGLGLYKRYEADPDAFRAELRRSAALDRCATTRRRCARASGSTSGRRTSGGRAWTSSASGSTRSATSPALAESR